MSKNFPTRVLIIDDDQRIRSLLKKFLSEQGFDIETAGDAREARSILERDSFDVLVIDVMMPGESGVDFMESIKKTSPIPCLLLTAKDHLDDKVAGFSKGADDYLTKPFEPLELSLRIQALHKRTQKKKESAPLLVLGLNTFNTQTDQLLNERGELIILSSTELLILKLLAQQPGQPISREDLSHRMGYKTGDRSVDVQIMRMRKKIGDDPKNPTLLRTIRHVGYALFPRFCES